MKLFDLRNKVEGSSCPRNVGKLCSHFFNLTPRSESLLQEGVLVDCLRVHISHSNVEVCIYIYIQFFIVYLFFGIVGCQWHTYVEAKYSSPSVIRVGYVGGMNLGMRSWR
jgi:hypothetical protein